MGMMTVVIVLNDAWTTIKANSKQFMQNIENGMGCNPSKKKINDFAVGNHANPMKVHTSFHADNKQVLVVGENHATNLYEFDKTKADDEFYLNHLYTEAQFAAYRAEGAKNRVLEAIGKLIEKDTKRGMTKREVAKLCKEHHVFMSLSPEDQHRVIQMIYGRVKSDEEGFD